MLKPVRPLLLPRAEKESLPAQRQSQEKMRAPAERAPGERSMAPPKSPLRLIANAIRRSLEPLLPNSDGGRKAWAKPESKTLPTSPPHAYTRSFSFRKSSSSKDSDQPSPKRDVASKASAFFSLGSPTARAAQPSALSPPAPAFGTHSEFFFVSGLLAYWNGGKHHKFSVFSSLALELNDGMKITEEKIFLLVSGQSLAEQIQP